MFYASRMPNIIIFFKAQKAEHIFRSSSDDVLTFLKTKRNPLYIRNQPVPSSKLFPPRL